MTLRLFLLRAMLWSLALSAATGVLAVLFQGGDLVWRVVGTGFVTAIACGLLLSVSTLIDHEKTRPAGLLGMTAVIAEFLMALALIWEGPRNLWGVSWEVEITLTMLFFGIAVVLIMSFLKLLQEPYGAVAGLVGVVASIAEFVMALLLIWDGPQYLWGVSWEEEIALTMMFFGMAVVLILCFLKMLRDPYGAVAGRVGVVATLVTFVACMIATWARRTPRSVFNENWSETTVSLAIFSGLAVLCLVGLGTGNRRHWRWTGIAASIIACTMWLIDIWIGAGSDLGYVIFCVLISMAVVVAHANLSFFCPVRPGQRWVRQGTIAAAVFTAGMIDLIAVDEKFPGIGISQDLVGRIAAAGGIVAGCGTLALCVLARMNRKVDLVPFTPELSEITVVCPRCRKQQPIRIGDSACAVCELRISIRIEEPRCPQCDYLLYGLTSDRCPECGAVIGAKASACLT